MFIKESQQPTAKPNSTGRETKAHTNVWEMMAKIIS